MSTMDRVDIGRDARQGDSDSRGRSVHQDDDDSAAACLRRMIGSRLQELRESQGLSVREAAARAGLSRSFVAIVERGNSEIAVSRLIRLADVYGIGIADLLEGTTSTQAEFLPASAMRVFPTGMDTIAIRYLSSPSWGVQPFLVDLMPAAKFEDLRHPGDEFIHCLTGTPTVVVDGKPHPLQPGDTIVVPSEMSHSYFNLTSEPATVIGGVARLGGVTRGTTI